eukprot:7465572-Pyramimonas_sp.AAC.1
MGYRSQGCMSFRNPSSDVRAGVADLRLSQNARPGGRSLGPFSGYQEHHPGAPQRHSLRAVFHWVDHGALHGEAPWAV